MEVVKQPSDYGSPVAVDPWFTGLHPVRTYPYRSYYDAHACVESGCVAHPVENPHVGKSFSGPVPHPCQEVRDEGGMRAMNAVFLAAGQG